MSARKSLSLVLPHSTKVINILVGRTHQYFCRKHRCEQRDCFLLRSVYVAIVAIRMHSHHPLYFSVGFSLCFLFSYPFYFLFLFSVFLKHSNSLLCPTAFCLCLRFSLLSLSSERMDGGTKQNGDWNEDTIRILKNPFPSFWLRGWEVAVDFAARLFREIYERQGNDIYGVGL